MGFQGVHCAEAMEPPRHERFWLLRIAFQPIEALTTAIMSAALARRASGCARACRCASAQRCTRARSRQPPLLKI